MNKKLLLFLFACFFCLSKNLVSFALENDFLVPAGEVFSAVLAQEINSESVTVGNKVEAIFVEDFIYNDKVIASKDSVMQGSVVAYAKKTKNEDAFIQIKFTTIRTPYNNLIPVSAVIKTKDTSGILKSKDNNGVVVLKPNERIEIEFVQPITMKAQ